MISAHFHVVNAYQLVVQQVQCQDQQQQDRTQCSSQAPVERDAEVIGDKIADQCTALSTDQGRRNVVTDGNNKDQQPPGTVLGK